LHSALLLISAFVGAGLVFSGITDSCGLAMVLARMPWNNTECHDNNTSKGSCSR
jgi:hypothetical protein